MRLILSMIFTLNFLVSCGPKEDLIFKIPQKSNNPAPASDVNNDLPLVQSWTLGFNSGNLQWDLIPK